MKFKLSKKEVELLKRQNIEFDSSHDYTDDEALDLLDLVRDSEAYYAQGTDKESNNFWREYTLLGDKIFSAIPED